MTIFIKSRRIEKNKFSYGYVWTSRHYIAFTWQIVAPVTAAKVPTTQAVHIWLPAPEYEPGWQETQALAAAAEYFPAGHVRYAVAPTLGAYNPGVATMQ